ncbi:unnamed protein product [Leptosia nina]|uniref:L-aminoadipate-semialdehyde dehydrogenase-phosphopantetheinyl transferase n=1 Tax=Leptosia nina TaxID=320188 RepID=A0AAV1J1U7_9NEOP
MSLINTRWAFNVSNWKPTEEQVLAISSFIQPEEKQRISRFVFQKDAKSSLIGRLLIRKYLGAVTDIPYQNIKVGRDKLGKPYLLGGGDLAVDFNVSHQADFVVLAGNTKQKIGIDVMKTEPLVGKDVVEFFRLMRRQFTDAEWLKIESYKTEAEKLASFYRTWCLKESYVKNRGIGVAAFPLDTLSFFICEELKQGEIITSTKLKEKNILKDYVFEETILDESYIVAVALENTNTYVREDAPFIFLTIDDLLNDAKSLSGPDPGFVRDFLGKKEKPY